MFATADWTQPQIGGLLSEIIEKEERQLRAPKPRITVEHVWDPNALKGRASEWEEVRPAPQQNIGAVRSKLGMSVPQLDDATRNSRSKIFAARRTRDSLAAMDRERASDATSGETGFKSAASLFTPAELQSLRPTYAPNETYGSATSSQLLGLGAAKVPLVKSRFNRMAPHPPDFTNCRNNPNRTMVERGLQETITRAKPWLTDPAPPLPQRPAAMGGGTGSVAPRSHNSSFCLRPNDYPIEQRR